MGTQEIVSLEKLVFHRDYNFYFGASKTPVRGIYIGYKDGRKGLKSHNRVLIKNSDKYGGARVIIFDGYEFEGNGVRVRYYYKTNIRRIEREYCKKLLKSRGI